MRTDISGIAKNILQVRANLKAEAPERGNGQGVNVSFVDMMNQNSLPNLNVSAGTKDMGFQADGKYGADAAYDKYLSGSKNISVKQEMTPEELQSEMAGTLEAYEEEIRNILKEELGVTDEEISKAMESLGMSFLDAGSLKDLTALVQELTGEDIGTLFLSEAFQNVMEQAAALTETLCAELGLTKEELSALCKAMEQAESSDVPIQPEAGKAEDGSALSENNSAAKTETANAVLAEEETGTVVMQKEETAQKEEPVKAPEESRTAEKLTVDTEKEPDTGSGGKGFLDHFTDAKTDISNTGAAFAGQQTVEAEEFILPQETPQPYTSQTDAYHLIDQIAKNVRVTVSGTFSSMEMQLNPEHLGKIYLNVTEREGVVRAQITTQSAVVKEALETQLVELRQSLNQQGIKVDAIEVTVGTHEFEQNLEENARQEEQMRQQMEESKKQAKRNINLSDLDGLSGLMSEEEQLAAQIMRDNGNQVDLMA